jgi:shikimate dehydrogenase
MPLKHAALAAGAEVRPRARAVGAANTLLPRSGGGWVAENTDVHGIVAAVAESGTIPATVTVVGGGGTAQAAVAALPEIGLRRGTVLVRDVGRGDAVRATAEAVGVTLEVHRLEVDVPALDADLTICTVPAGAADPLAGHAWRGGQILLDAVYDPWPTAVATAVTGAGGTVLSGALMLLHQAAGQVELMTGQAAPVAAMRAALRAAIPAADL